MAHLVLKGEFDWPKFCSYPGPMWTSLGFKYLSIIVFLTGSVCFAEPVAQICQRWFERAKIRAKGQDCVVECSVISVDMATFQCPNSCDDFCKILKNEPSPLDQVTGFFGFNMEELHLVLDSPRTARKAYELSRLANSMTEKVLRRNLPGDESDAFRHFVWAALMTRDLGSDMARKVLDAHEADLPSSDPDRAMDLANNNRGIEAAKTLLKANKASDDRIEKAAIAALKEKKLIVRSPTGDAL